MDFGSLEFGGSGSDQIPPPNPLQILGSALAVWHDPDDATKYVITGRGYSQIGNSADAATYDGALVQATDARRPRQFYLRGSHYGALHNSTETHRMTASLLASVPVPWTTVEVKQQIGSGTMVSSARTGGITQQTTGATFPKTILHNAGSTLNAASAIEQDELYVIERYVTAAGTGGEIRLNGSLLATGTTGVLAWQTDIWRGSSASLTAHDQAHYGDWLLIKRQITATERNLLQNYFRWKYHIGLGLMRHWVPVGDSITLGTGSADGCGWRRVLSDTYIRRMIGGNKWVVSLGNTRNFNFVDDRHAGVGGQSIAGATALIAALFGPGNLYNAPVVFYMIGTYNMASYVAGTTEDAYEQSVRDIDSLITSALGVRPYIIVTTIPDADPVGHATQHNNTLLYNAALPARWTELEGDGLRLVRADVYTAVGPYSVANYYQVDGLGVHLNDTGNALVAAHLLPILDSTMALVA